MKIDNLNQDLDGPMGDDFYEVVLAVVDGIMRQAAGDDELMEVYEVLFQSMFENALLYNYIVSAGMIKSPEEVLKIKSDVEEHIDTIAKARNEDSNNTDELEKIKEFEESGEPIWSMDQMKEFMEGKKI